MALIGYRTHEFVCGHCGASNAFLDISTSELWANQHGAGFRTDCVVCGYWTDASHTEKRGLRTRTFKPIEPSLRYRRNHPNWRKEWKDE